MGYGAGGAGTAGGPMSRGARYRGCVECGDYFPTLTSQSTRCAPCQARHGHASRRRPSERFKYARKAAYARGFTFSISIVEYCAIIAQPCTYCGGPLPEVGSGLDRIDPLEGYITGNVLPCCEDCNRIKGPYLTVEMMHSIRPIILAVKARYAQSPKIQRLMAQNRSKRSGRVLKTVKVAEACIEQPRMLQDGQLPLFDLDALRGSA